MFKHAYLSFLLATVSLFAAPVVDFEWIAPSPHRLTWVDMAAGNGRFVGIAGVYETIGYEVYVSSDGRAWKHAATPGGLPLREVDGAIWSERARA